MLGAYLAHGNDMNTAIYVFRQLCGIKGHVWPISLENDLHISARLENGEWRGCGARRECHGDQAT
jgi:hypothetical protein